MSEKKSNGEAIPKSIFLHPPAQKVQSEGIEELCGRLNEHAKKVCPDLSLDFLPSMKQPGVAAAFIYLSTIVSFDVAEFKVLKHKLFAAIFADRLNGTMCGVTQAASILIDPPEKEVQSMDFSEALKAMKGGSEVYRFSDKEKVLTMGKLENGQTVLMLRGTVMFGVGKEYEKEIALIWLPNSDDLLADDWWIVT